MRSLVLYDTVFGNTEQIAHAIAEALGDSGDVQVLRVSDAQPEQLIACDLLVVGSPTRGFRPTPATTTLLEAIPAGGLDGARVAAFDTRIALKDIRPGVARFFLRLTGYRFAAPSLAGRLQKKGGRPVAAPEGFHVLGSEGPLRDGELERAAQWARGLLETESQT